MKKKKRKETKERGKQKVNKAVFYREISCVFYTKKVPFTLTEQVTLSWMDI